MKAEVLSGLKDSDICEVLRTGFENVDIVKDLDDANAVSWMQALIRGGGITAITVVTGW